MGRFLILLGIFSLFICLPVFSEEYYADVTIEVDYNGEVTISGQTNHPQLLIEKTQNYTSKDGTYWTLNISISDIFSDYIFDVSFPEGTVINYLKVPSSFRIETYNGRLHLIGTGQEKPLFVVIQYRFEEKNTEQDYQILLGLIFAMVLLVILYYFKLNHKKSKKKKSEDKFLTERQKQIVSYIENKKEPVAQAELQRELKFPKASLSRNIDSLVNKGILKKGRKGMTNLIYLVEE